MIFPKNPQDATAHRHHKRSVEVSLIIEHIAKALPQTAAHPESTLRVLEFGSGNGFQLPYLKTIGEVVASDLYESEAIRNIDGVRFVKCSIESTGFGDSQFDVIFSNHVIEHLERPEDAFRELKRIGTPTCLYAFAVPTNVWLLLTIPEQYRAKLRQVRRSAPARGMPSGSENIQAHARDLAAPPVRARDRGQISYGSRLMRKLLPAGHGVIANFWACYRQFKVANWEQFFRDHGFSVVGRQPLLLYGPSEWPIIPTRKNMRNICSSILFLLKKP